MEDDRIIGMFFERSENAISETQNKYGRYCHSIALRILGSDEDAEECVNDTYVSLWNAIPPQSPGNLKQFIGRIARNIAINRYNYNNASKRLRTSDIILDEYSECIPDNAESIADNAAFKEMLNDFLEALPEDTRIMFLRRYWYFRDIKEIAEGMNISPGTVKSTLFRTREKLRCYLEGFDITLNDNGSHRKKAARLPNEQRGITHNEKQ